MRARALGVAVLVALMAGAATPLYAHDSGMGLVRYTADGHLDVGFGHDGVVAERTPLGGLSPEALVIQADGKLVLVGTSSDVATAGVGFGLARYTPEGSVDRGFGVGGRVLSRVGAATAEAHAAMLQPDGGLVVAGSGFVATTEVSDFALARYTPDGLLDPTFGASGVVLTPIGPSGAEARAIALQPDGRIVVAGTAFASGAGEDSLALARYNADGSPDRSFGSGGKVILASGAGGPVRAAALVIQSDGKLVGVGSIGGHQGGFVLARFLPAGDLDTAFGASGRSASRQVSAQAYAADIQPDGNIVVAGGLVSATNDNVAFALARYRSNGDLDVGFGSGSVVTTMFQGGGSGAHAIRVGGDGNIVAAGSGSGAFAVARYLPSGAPDTSFGQGGVALATVGDAGSMPAALGIQPDGKLLAAGQTYFLVPTPGASTLPASLLVLMSGVVLAGVIVAAWARRRASTRAPPGVRSEQRQDAELAKRLEGGDDADQHHQRGTQDRY